MTEGVALTRGIGAGAATLGALPGETAIFACVHLFEGDAAACDLVIEGGDVMATCGEEGCAEARPQPMALLRVLEGAPSLARMGEAREGWAFMRPDETMAWRAFPPEDG